MAGDPLAEALAGRGAGDDPYGVSEAFTIIDRLLKSAAPEAVADAMESYLQRLALLELYLEDALELTIDGDDLKRFREEHLPELKKATTQLAHLLHGHVARREG